MTDLRYYIMLATGSGAYKDIEIEIMKESLLEWERRPDSRAILVELASGGRVSGFAYYTPVNGTEYTFDIKWLVVDKMGRRRDIGEQLIDRIEADILNAHEDAILLVETSAVKERAVEEGFWEGAGFSLIGRIPGFYGKGDDYLMYAAHLSRDGGAGAEAETSIPGREDRP